MIRPGGRALPALALLGGLGLAGLAGSVAGCAGGGGGAPATAPGPPPTADAPQVTARQVMVTLRPAPPSLWAQTIRELEVNYRLRTVLAWSMASIGERCIVFDIAINRSAAQVVQQLHGDPRLSTVQVIQTFEALGGPAEPAAQAPAADRGYDRLQRGAQMLRLAAAHRMATGRGVRVAVVDTGVDVGHPDLRNRIAKASNFVDRGEQTFTSDIHGTAVAGAIAADEKEGRIVSAAPEAEIFALKACWPQPPDSRQAVCNSYTLAKAIDFAIVEHAQVLNFSLAGPSDPLLARLIRTALDRGIAVVAAVAPAGSRPSFPAALAGVIGVVASDLQGALRSPPPPGSWVAAPGVDILTTVPHGSYDFFSGSSLAAAEVSGIVALLLERNPKLTPAQVREALVRSSTPIREQPGDSDPEVGMVDACGALALIPGGGSCADR